MDARTKALWSTLFVLGFVVTYLLPNHYPVGTPRLLPLSDWERSIPLLPWTFVVYMSDFVLGAWAVLQVRRERDFLEMARVATSSMLLCGLVFVVFPTTYPRPPYPENSNGLSGWLMQLLASTDSPNNAFPSMHVAMTAACVWGLRHTVPRWAVPLVVLWGLAISAATLTTKQHYLWDVFGGALAFALAVALHRAIERRFGDRAWPGWMFVGGRGPGNRTPLPEATPRVLPNENRGRPSETPSAARSGSSRSSRAR